MEKSYHNDSVVVWRWSQDRWPKVGQELFPTTWRHVESYKALGELAGVVSCCLEDRLGGSQ